MSKTCPDCSRGGFTNLGMHISQSNCIYPDLSEYHVDILIGALMGDGHVRDTGLFEIGVINRDYLEWLVKELPNWLITSSGIQLNFDDRESSQDYFKIRTVSCDETKHMRNLWYNSGEKKFPLEEINLSKTIMRHWYVTDGGLDERNRVTFYSTNERTTELRDWLIENGYDCCSDSYSVRLNKDQSNDFLNNIDTLPGYEYKFNL